MDETARDAALLGVPHPDCPSRKPFMQLSFLRIFAAIIASAILAACGGGGAGTANAVPQPSAVPQASAAPGIAAANVSLTFIIPARVQQSSGRSPHYISPNTTDLFVFVDGSANPSASVSTSSCQAVAGANPAGQRQCFVGVTVTPGLHSFKVLATESVTVAASTFKFILSQGTLSNFNAVSGDTTAPALTLNAVITNVIANGQLTPPTLSGIQGQPTTVNFAVLDGTGGLNGTLNTTQTAQINLPGVLGSYDNGPLTFAANDTLVTIGSGGPFNAPGTDPATFSFTCNGPGTSQINWTASSVATVIQIGAAPVVSKGSFPVTCAAATSNVTIPLQ
jgi:hypothetical protein